MLPPASRPAVTPQLSPAPPFQSETCSACSVRSLCDSDVLLFHGFLSRCLTRVEGCLPVCPSHMVLDEVTHRCVYVEDCEHHTCSRILDMIIVDKYFSLCVFFVTHTHTRCCHRHQSSSHSAACNTVFSCHKCNHHTQYHHPAH